MSAENGGQAFPVVETHELYGCRVHEGMTLRDWFAGMALQGMCANELFDEYPWQSYSKRAYEAADAMLEARGQ